MQAIFLSAASISRFHNKVTSVLSSSKAQYLQQLETSYWVIFSCCIHGLQVRWVLVEAHILQWYNFSLRMMFLSWISYLSMISWLGVLCLGRVTGHPVPCPFMPFFCWFHLHQFPSLYRPNFDTCPHQICPSLETCEWILALSNWRAEVWFGLIGEKLEHPSLIRYAKS